MKAAKELVYSSQSESWKRRNRKSESGVQGHTFATPSSFIEGDALQAVSFYSQGREAGSGRVAGTEAKAFL